MVAPHMGAWIEIDENGQFLYGVESHPTWVRGLKYSESDFGLAHN